VDAGRDGVDIPAVGVFVVMRKSAVRLVLESFARRALRSEEAVVGCWCWVAGALALEEDGDEAVVSAGWCLKVDDDEGRVINDALSLLFSASVEGVYVRFPCRAVVAAEDFRVSVWPRRCV
jgi:hypothetical protein